MAAPCCTHVDAGASSHLEWRPLTAILAFEAVVRQVLSGLPASELKALRAAGSRWRSDIEAFSRQLLYEFHLLLSTERSSGSEQSNDASNGGLAPTRTPHLVRFLVKHCGRSCILETEEGMDGYLQELPHLCSKHVRVLRVGSCDGQSPYDKVFPQWVRTSWGGLQALSVSEDEAWRLPSFENAIRAIGSSCRRLRVLSVTLAWGVDSRREGGKGDADESFLKQACAELLNSSLQMAFLESLELNMPLPSLSLPEATLSAPLKRLSLSNCNVISRNEAEFLCHTLCKLPELETLYLCGSVDTKITVELTSIIVKHCVGVSWLFFERCIGVDAALRMVVEAEHNGVLGAGNWLRRLERLEVTASLEAPRWEYVQELLRLMCLSRPMLHVGFHDPGARTMDDFSVGDYILDELLQECRV